MRGRFPARVCGAIVPLDAALYPLFRKQGLKMRNRIVWRFGHGLHCSKRFSGRYETIHWWTRSDDYTFHLDPVRVPAKYPNKRHFKGPNIGQLSGKRHAPYAPHGKTRVRPRRTTAQIVTASPERA